MRLGYHRIEEPKLSAMVGGDQGREAIWKDTTCAQISTLRQFSAKTTV
jgi:hypothetical protein